MVVNSPRCSVCEKQLGTSYCTGCGSYFCTKHFGTHRQTLSVELELILTHRNTLQEKIQHKNKHSSNHQNPLFEQIDEWQTTTIQKVKQTADRARAQLTELLEAKRSKLSHEFKRFSQELVDLKQSENFVEHDLIRLKRLLQQLNHDLKHWHQPTTIEIHTEQTNKIEWNRLIYPEEKSAYPAMQQKQQQIAGACRRSAKISLIASHF